MKSPSEWSTDEVEAYKDGKKFGERCGGHFAAQEMRILFCALITAHKRRDDNAFWATVEIAKHQLSKYANFNDEDWALFRNDCPRKD